MNTGPLYWSARTARSPRLLDLGGPDRLAGPLEHAGAGVRESARPERHRAGGHHRRRARPARTPSRAVILDARAVPPPRERGWGHAAPSEHLARVAAFDPGRVSGDGGRRTRARPPTRPRNLESRPSSASGIFSCARNPKTRIGSVKWHRRGASERPPSSTVIVELGAASPQRSSPTPGRTRRASTRWSSSTPTSTSRVSAPRATVCVCVSLSVLSPIGWFFPRRPRARRRIVRRRACCKRPHSSSSSARNLEALLRGEPRPTSQNRPERDVVLVRPRRGLDPSAARATPAMEMAQQP